MSAELGYSLGEGLESYQEGLVLTVNQVKGELAMEKTRLKEEIERLSAGRDSLLRVERSLQGRLVLANQPRLRVEQRREAASAEFSLVKGTLYIGISALLIFADISILGQVFAQLLGYPWVHPVTRRTFTQQLFTDPSQALKDFPDLLYLTVSLLLIGFFIKIWKDWYAIRFDNERSLRRSDHLKFILYSMLLMMSVVSVVLMASARLTFDMGEASGNLSRAASAFLGLTLPFVSAGFFMEGYDCLASRGLLWRLSLMAWLYRAPLFLWAARRRRADAALKVCALALEQLESDEHRQKLLGAREVAYAHGYREGVKSLLASPGPGELYGKLRPIAVRRLLARS